MKALAVIAVLGLAFLEGRYTLKGRKTKEILAYGAIVALALALILIEVLYYQPVRLTRVIDILFQPISKPVLMFLRQH